MRLLIIGNLDGHIATAGKIALERGAKVAHEETVERALAALRSGQGADLVMIDVHLNIRQLCASLDSERISVPVVAFGIGAETRMAVDAIKAGAKEYIPLPPDAELIAAVLAAVAEETSAAYRAVGATVLSTASAGSVAVQLAEGLRVETFHPTTSARSVR